MSKCVDRVMSKWRNRKGDTRSILTKALCGVFEPKCDADMVSLHLAEARAIRGDLENDKQNCVCLYCGEPATEIDHYKSAVYAGVGRFIVETPVNRVPSCSGCHRAGKDRVSDIVKWHARTDGSKKHPRRVVPHKQWLVAHNILIKWDVFHQRVIGFYVCEEQMLLQHIVEEIVWRMYDKNEEEVRRLVTNALTLSTQTHTLTYESLSTPF